MEVWTGIRSKTGCMDRKTMRALIFPTFGLLLALAVAAGVYAYIASHL